MANSLDCFSLCFCCYCFSICGHSGEYCCRLPCFCCPRKRDKDLEEIERELQMGAAQEANLYKPDSREHLQPPSTMTQVQPGIVPPMDQSGLGADEKSSAPDGGLHRKSISRGGLSPDALGEKGEHRLGSGSGSIGGVQDMGQIPMALRPGGGNIRDKANIMADDN